MHFVKKHLHIIDYHSAGGIAIVSVTPTCTGSIIASQFPMLIFLLPSFRFVTVQQRLTYFYPVAGPELVRRW